MCGRVIQARDPHPLHSRDRGRARETRPEHPAALQRGAGSGLKGDPRRLPSLGQWQDEELGGAINPAPVELSETQALAAPAPEAKALRPKRSRKPRPTFVGGKAGRGGPGHPAGAGVTCGSLGSPPGRQRAAGDPATPEGADARRRPDRPTRRELQHPGRADRYGRRSGIWVR